MVSLYIDDTSAEDVRPTKDIDITMEIASLGELEKIREELIQKGFYQTSEDNVICRFRYEDIKVEQRNKEKLLEVNWKKLAPPISPPERCVFMRYFALG